MRIAGENPCAVCVPASGFAEAVWEADLSEAFALSDHIKIVVRPTGGVPERTLPLAVSLIGQPTIARSWRDTPNGFGCRLAKRLAGSRTFRPTAGSI